jgi:uncharacterized oxidoreductase
MQLSGNTILITGGTSGLGWAFAAEFAREGNTVIVCGRRTKRLAEIKAKHPGIITYPCDISKDADREALFTWATTHYPQLNILMNNAGMQLAADLTKPVNTDLVRKELETNFVAPVHLASLFAHHLQQQERPAIINITSGLAFVPIAFMPVYCASKAALHSLTLSLRHQLKDTGVKVYEIAPPSVDTELGHERRADKTQSHGGIPVGEFLAEAMEALRNDLMEAPIGQSKGLRAKGDELFDAINTRFSAQ